MCYPCWWCSMYCALTPCRRTIVMTLDIQSHSLLPVTKHFFKKFFKLLKFLNAWKQMFQFILCCIVFVCLCIMLVLLVYHVYCICEWNRSYYYCYDWHNSHPLYTHTHTYIYIYIYPSTYTLHIRVSLLLIRLAQYLF